MKKVYWFLISLLILLIFGLILYITKPIFLYRILPMEDYVYGSANSRYIEERMEDCKKRGGTFYECGTCYKNQVAAVCCHSCIFK